MNLKKSIRRILREEFNPIRARRTIHIADEYFNKLNPKDICNYWDRDEVDNYIAEVMADIIREMIYELGDMSNEEFSDYYHKLYIILLEFKYRQKIKDFFLESLDNCK
jgi:hypothetical protein